MFYLQCINRKCVKENKHQHLTLYQNWNRTPVYFKLAVSASLLFAEYSVKSLWFDIFIKYTIYFLEPNRKFTFIHMLIYQLCYIQLCRLREKAPGQLIHFTQFVKSFTPQRFPSFASPVVDDITKICFSTPVLTS